ncbi:SHOCT domain-containing protein [Nocardia lasii]|uniref:SHOCT domain-containing protein n=1 Tax=Nocardia lasii TaxID=1616107 RepID=A0ABW1JV34_9NOCA
MSVWNVLWLIIVSFAFVAYLFLLFAIITDLFRNHQSSGWVKAIWVLFLFIFPLLTALIYLIVEGNGMAKRSAAAEKQSRSETDDYIKHTAGTNPATQIADAKKLLDAGTITDTEYQQLKAKALA